VSKLSYLLSLTPLETWRLVRRRMPILRNGPAWTPSELLASSKYGRGIRFAELLMRQEAVVRRHVQWEPLNFEDKRVVEIGCGPLAGFGPLAIFLGAKSFESAEPEWNPDLFTSDLVSESYLRIFHADLVALYGERMDFKTFQSALSKQMAIYPGGFESAPITGKVDVVLSQSCLEHVFPLEDTISKLAVIQTPQTRFLHLVDFGNHYPTINQFEGLYEQPRAEYLLKRPHAINLLRAPDVQTLFSAQGIPARLIPSRMAGANYSGTIHPWWSERYKDDALFTQLALVVGPVV
jgi:hypothetical protein